MHELQTLLWGLVAALFLFTAASVYTIQPQMANYIVYDLNPKYILFYMVVIILQIIRRILNNMYWQASRDAMKLDINSRKKYICKLMVLSTLNFVLWVINIIFVTTKDIITISCLFIGRIVSEWVVIAMMEPDQNTAFRLATKNPSDSAADQCAT